MRTNENMTPSIEEVSQKEAKKFSLKLCVRLSLVFVIAYIYFLYIAVSKNTSDSIEASRLFMIQSIKLGNIFALDTQLKSLTEKEFSAAALYYLLGDEKKSIAVANNGNNIEQANGPIALIDGQLTYISNHFIGSSGDKKFYLGLAKPLDSRVPLIWFSILIGGIFSIWRFSQQSFKALAKSYNEPISLLVKTVNEYDKINENKIMDRDLSFTELLQLHEVFRKQWNKIKINEREIVNLVKDRAIAQTTQMLAHDVRKPFTMLQALINIISDTQEPLEAKSILIESLPTISAAMNSVNGLIHDVMEIGAESNINKESIEPATILINTLSNVFSYNETADIEISYLFQHKHKLNVDIIKTGRIFINILGNAVELMKGQGRIWITTNEFQGMICFCIGNSNTYISPEDTPKLFEAFFTKNKKGGTGLGLAIAKKITEAHGGKIWCKSSNERGTEFFFTLPITDEISNKTELELPNHSSKYSHKIAITAVTDSVLSTKRSSDYQLELEKEITNRRNITTIPLRVAIVDDEPIYIKSLVTSINSLKCLDGLLEIYDFPKAESIIDKIRQGETFDLAIIDVDYGSGNISGFEASEHLRNLGFNGKICIHSNRGALEYQPRAIEVGADLFLPKPMAKEHLLAIILSLIPNRNRQSTGKIILIEDEHIFQRQWARLLIKDRLVAFKGLDDLKNFIINIPSWNEFDCIVTDYFLEDGETALDVANYLSAIECPLPLFLYSNMDYSNESQVFAAVLPKQPSQAYQKIYDFLKFENLAQRTCEIDYPFNINY